MSHDFLTIICVQAGFELLTPRKRCQSQNGFIKETILRNFQLKLHVLFNHFCFGQRQKKRKKKILYFLMAHLITLNEVKTKLMSNHVISTTSNKGI